MTASFQADPSSIQSASKAFTAQVQPINSIATATEDLHFSGGNAGRQYAAQGNAYHAAMLTFVQKMLTPMATKTTWVGDTLASTATTYQQQDQTAKSGLQQAGKGA